jgi:tetratricopeptide (TPR) repeat protein
MNLDKLKEAARKFEQKEQWRQAIDVYKKALKEQDEAGESGVDPSLYNRVGDLEMKAGDASSAVRAYEQAADLYTEQGFFNNAIAVCGKILRVNPGRTPTYLRLAQLHARKNFVGEAKKNLVEYIERLDALQHREEAFNAVKIFADQFSGNSDIRLMLVDLLRASSRNEEAREQLQKLANELEARGDSSGARRTREQLQSIEVDHADAVQPVSLGSSSDLVFLDTGIPASGASPAVSSPPPESGELVVLHTAEEEMGGGGATAVDAELTERLPGLDEISVEVDPAWQPAPIEGLEVIETRVMSPEEEMPASDLMLVTTPFEETASDETVEVEPLEIESLPDPDLDLDLDAEVLELEPIDEALTMPAVAPDGVTQIPVDDDLALDQVESVDLSVAAPPAAPPTDLVFLDVGKAPADLPAAPEPPPPEDQAIVLRDRGRLLIRVGDRPGGIGVLEEALQRLESQERWGEALQLADELSQLEPEAIFRHQKRVEIAYRSGHRAEMIQAYLGLADTLLAAGGRDHALHVYRRVLEHEPDNPAATAAVAALTAPPPAPSQSFVDLGALILDEPQNRDTRIRVDQKEPIEDEDQAFHEALAQFKRGIEENLDAEDFQAHYDLGIAFKEMGLLDEAIAQFQKALRSPDGRLRTSEQLGIAFYEKARFAIAEAVLRRAVDGLPGADDEKIGLLYWLGRALEAQRRREEALKFYERALAVDIRFLDLGERVHHLTAERAE